MAVRAFDNWNSYLDNDGNLLHGKIRFCKKGTTDNVIIYNSDGTVALRNPEFTDMLGRTEYQVFVDSEADVTAYFYKYVGNGDMMGTAFDDYDPERWEYQYSSDNLDPAKVITLEADTAHGVATMADMRAKDPDDVPVVNGSKFMWLYGYYQSGDKSPVLYVWDSASLRNDDGGAVICPSSVSGQGRWILASKDYIFDVRHFGIFGQVDKYSTDYSYTSQLSNCADYLTKEGMNAWFPELYNSLAYYLFDGTNTFSIPGDIYISDGVRFMCKTGTSGTAIQCANIHKAAPYLFDSSVQTGSATLTADNINISWVGGQVTGNARNSWTIDTSDFARVITGKRIIFEVNGHYGIQLDNCQVESHKAITGPIVMQNMPIKTEWFADNYSWGNLSLYNCTVKLQDCKDADTYILLKNKLLQYDYGDLGEQTVHNASFGAGAVVENCGGTATFAGDAELHNVTLTASFTASTTYINCLDTWLTINGTPTFTMIQMNRGSIGGSAGINILNTLKCTDVTIDNSVSLLGATLLLDNCVINGAISHLGNPIEENVRNCIFNNSITISGGETDSVVHAIWQDNVGFVASPIVLDRTYLDPDDTAHTYTYSGNTGTFVQRDHVVLAPAMLLYSSEITTSFVQPFTYLSFSSGMNNDGTTDTTKYLCEFRMFSVGTENVGRVVVTSNPAGYFAHSNPTYKQSYNGAAMPSTADTVERTVAEWQSEAQVGFYFPKGLSFMGGYTWRITRLDNFWMGVVTDIPADMKWSFIVDRV